MTNPGCCGKQLFAKPIFNLLQMKMSSVKVCDFLGQFITVIRQLLKQDVIDSWFGRVNSLGCKLT